MSYELSVANEGVVGSISSKRSDRCVCSPSYCSRCLVLLIRFGVSIVFLNYYFFDLFGGVSVLKMCTYVFRVGGSG